MDELKVKVRLFPISGGGHMVSRAIVTLDHKDSDFNVRLSGFRVMQGKKGLWVAVPQDKYMVGEEIKYKPTVFLNQVAREIIFSAVLSEYQKSPK